MDWLKDLAPVERAYWEALEPGDKEAIASCPTTEECRDFLRNHMRAVARFEALERGPAEVKEACLKRSGQAADAARLRIRERQNRGREACTLLDDLCHDLVTAVRADEVFAFAPGHTHAPENDPVRVGLNRMRIFHILLALCKSAEFFDYYSDCIPSDCHDIFKDLRNEIRRRGIVDFRNRYIGHIWDDKKQRPLRDAEAEAAISNIQNGDEKRFLAWVHIPERLEFPKTVVSILSRTQTRIAVENMLDVKITIDTTTTPERVQIDTPPHPQP